MNTLFETDYDADSRKRTFLNWFEGILLVAGLICFGWYGYNWIASEADQLWSGYQLDAAARGETPTIRGLLRDLASGQKQTKPETATQAEKAPEPPLKVEPERPVHIANGANIGRIEIPRLQISAIVRQGVDDKVLGRAVGHVPSTALPGKHGNVGLAAHRDSYFRNLRDVREGDVIRMVTPDGNWEYQVESMKIVTPANVEVLDPTPHPSLTLVTCYPFNYIGHAPKRFIVRARQLGADESQTLAASTPPVPVKKRLRGGKRRS